MALVGTACFISGLLLLYLPYHSQGIIHDFAVNLFNGYVYSSASILGNVEKVGVAPDPK